MPKALEAKLKKQAKKNIKKGVMDKAKEAAYVYGTMAKIEKAKKK